MNKRKVKIIVRSLSEISKEWKQALKGKKVSVQKDNVIIVTPETAARLFAKTRLEVLKVILSEMPKSINEIARITGRDFKAVYADVRLLYDIGLIDLKEGSRTSLKPVAKFSDIELDLAA
ncbi:MAG: hypothetical protein HY391_03345 [Deltaproteobacteria bacterium]|nr:hypothetical protein [Deltaproteobacteria bacterium]